MKKLLFGFLLVCSFLMFNVAKSQCLITYAFTQIICSGYKWTLDSAYLTVNNPPGGGFLIIRENGTNAQDTIFPPFTNPIISFPSSQFPNINAAGLPPGPGTGPSFTFYFSSNPACTQTINYSNIPGCFCNHSAGTVTATMAVGNQSSTNYVLCIDDAVTINSNNDYTFLSQPPFPAPGLTYGIYKCPPSTTVDPTVDTCLIGITGVGTGITITNLYGSQAGGLLFGVPGITNNTLYFAPIGLYQTPSFIDPDCYDVGPATPVTFLDSITATMNQVCPSGFNVTIQGGSPALFGGNYTLSNISPVYATFSTTSLPQGGTVNISNLNNGDNFSFDVTDPYGCSTTISGGPYAAPLTVNFTKNSVCLGSTITFTNTSSGPASWLWNFGDGSTSTLTNPTKNYALSGTYQVKLVGTNSAGCKDSITKTVNVHPLPNVSFTPNPSSTCLGQQICFTNNSTISSGMITNWQWLFGDGSPANNTQSPCYTYSSNGAFTVTLIATSDSNCTSNTTQNVTVVANPTANYTFVSACVGQNVTFNNTSVGGTSWLWDFGDGTPTSNLQNPVHPYSSAGNYNVQLIAINGQCRDTIIQVVNVFNGPTADFLTTNVCEGTIAQFTDNSVLAGGSPIATWSWTFGDGNTSNAQNPTNTYNTPGTYNVQLVVTDANGCNGSITKTITIYPNPTAGFTFSNLCEGDVTIFTSTSSANGGVISAQNWTFGDGLSGLGSPVNHPYAGTGNYNVQLVVVSTNGCADSITLPVSITPLPIVDFSGLPITGCSPLCVNFINNSTIPSGTISSYTWNFGDGTFSSTVNTNKCYTNSSLSANYYTISLTATSDKGCVASEIKTNYVEVYPNPAANFFYSPQLISFLNPTVEFTNTSSGNDLNWWDFGNGSTSNNINPTQTYGDTGFYTVWLIVENSYGCRDSIEKQLYITPIVNIYIPNTFTPDLDGKNDFFFPVHIGFKELELLIFDRWGELIYEGGELNSRWDGTYKGVKVQTGVYVYKVNGKDVLGKKHAYIGKVTLLK